MLKNSCIKYDFWPKNETNTVNKVSQKMLLRYSTEIKIGCESLSLNADNKYDISPFYPLCAFPQRDKKSWIDFEKKMIRAESAQTIGLDSILCKASKLDSPM